MKNCLNSLAIVVALFLFIPSIALSQVVTNLNDAGPGSLRDVIATANPGDTITFDPSLNGGTITLLSQIQIEVDLTINGPGPENLTVSGGNTTRMLQIVSPMTPTTDVIISNLRFADGFFGFAAAIVMDTPGEFECNNCVFESNTASSGGGGVGGVFTIDTDNVNAVFNNCTFRFNRTLCIDCCPGCPSIGGVINMPGDNSLEVRNSTFSHNSNLCETENCGSGGGAIAIDSSFGDSTTFTSINNTFVSNSSICEAENCTARGGAILVEGENLTANFLFNTFSNNSVSCSGTGCTESGDTIFNEPEDDSNRFVNVGSSIFETLSSLGNCGGTNITSLGYNIDSGNTCLSPAGPGDKPNTNPRLDPRGLLDNGGPTQTVALIVGSPAIDMASPDCPPPNTDQRGFPRAEGAGCDIGAYEGSIIAPQLVPTLNQWSLIGLATILGIVGFIVVRRRVVA